ncbi:Glutamate receptor ionotropic, delta-1 [Portunus trituberculatus]|uniref:Glutamate receptor ionotropic, delta-1 n=1 Tax=Portunus trituberculatus TaxID=210409 RepID=A0A5B7E652_PORTR|nr:Glutamate receptor ionotropic, delta-1 [Portunus trituberculatus]
MGELNASRCLKLVSDQFISVVHISGTPGNYQYSGPLVTILDIILHHLGFCYEFLRASDRSYGLLRPNGSWSGLLGMVQRREADLTGTVIAITAEGLPAFDFSEPVLISEYNVINARPVVTPNMLGLCAPGVGFIAAELSHRLGCHSAGAEEPRHHADHGPARKSKLRSSRCNKSLAGVPWEPLGSSARLLTGLWLLETLILSSVYRSNLKAMLIIPKVRLPFDNLEELVESGTTLAISKDSTLQTLIMVGEGNTSLGRLKKSLLIVHPDHAFRFIEDIYKGKWAGGAFTTSLKAAFHLDFSVMGKCRGYMMSRGFFGPASLSLAFAKRSPLIGKVNKDIITLREAGILDHLFSQASFNATECLKPVTTKLTTTKERPLELLDFYGVFSLYMAELSEFTYDPKTFSVTPAMKEAFKTNGYVIIRQVLNPEEMRKVKQMLESPEVQRHAYTTADDIMKQTRMVLWFKVGEDVAGCVASMNKIAGTVEQVDCASIFLAVDDCTKANGCLEVLRGSHRMGRIHHAPAGKQLQADLERVEEARKLHEHLYMEMKAGDILYFTGNLLHRSLPNTTDKRRWSYVIAYNQKHNRTYMGPDHPRYTPHAGYVPMKKVSDSALLECQKFSMDDQWFLKEDEDKARE